MNRTQFPPGISPAVSRALAARGITQLFPIQEQVLAPALAGRDVLAQSPTGSGKTLAFGIPLAERCTERAARVEALVLVPTRELALQVADEIEPLAGARRVGIACVFGGAPIGRQIRACRTAGIVIATPGRLQDLIDQRAVDLSRVRTLVLDEADRMLDMGFAPQVDRILRHVPRKRQTLLFSATLEGAVGDIAARSTHDAVTVTVAPTRVRTRAITHEFVNVDATNRIDPLLDTLDRDRDLALVFVRTKRGADRLCRQLRRQGVDAGSLHGGMTQSARTRELKDFDHGRIDVMVATDVFARGIDLDGITHVINFDPPADADTYTHRTGRTGRAGRTGHAITLVTSEQREDVQGLATELQLLSEYEHAGIPLIQRRPPARPAAHREAGPAAAPARRRRRSRGRRRPTTASAA